ncbi:MAG: type II secretion system major pseudopilin GspG [Gammaproteobacteria bacterium]
MHPTQTRHGGFTLIEILVVVLILGLLASVVAPNLLGKVGGARAKAAKVQVEDLGAALDLYYLEVGAYPTTEQGLNALVERPAGSDRWNGPYLKKTQVPRDPWDRDYHYRSPGEHGPYDLYSYGADNAEGGTDDGADIVSWK